MTYVATLVVPNDRICSFHPNLHILATFSVNNTVKLWSLIQTSDGWTATCMTTLVGHNRSVYSITFHPTALLLATSSYDNTVKLWRLEPDGSTVTCMETMKGQSGHITSLAFHPTVPVLASGSFDKTVKLWYFGYTLDRSNIRVTCVATLGSTE
jgi:WD40 repeat protein